MIKVIADKSKIFSFKKLLLGMTIKWLILLVPLLVALLIKGLGRDFEADFGVTVVIKILIVSEFISALGNIYTTKTGKIVKDIDLFTYLFKFLRVKVLRIVEIYTKVKFKEEVEKDVELEKLKSKER